MIFYHFPPDYEKKADAFKVLYKDTVIEVLEADVSAAPINQVWPGYQRPFEQTEKTYFTSLETDGAFTLTITPPFSFQDVTVRPLSKKVTPVIRGDSVTVSFPGVGQYCVEFDDRHHVFTVFANPIHDFTVTESPDVVFFGAGIHVLDKPFEFKDNQTVILDKEAVVYGSFFAQGKTNVCLCGYGILDNSRSKRGNGGAAVKSLHSGIGTPMIFDHCHNVSVQGLTVVNSSEWSMHFAGCDGVKVDGIKLIGMWRYNADGCDFTNTQNAVIQNSFLRNFDDCLVIKGLIFNKDLPVDNIVAENCVVWCDWGRAMEIGAETCAPYMRGIRFKNIDVIHGDAVMMDIQHGDGAEISDVTFEDIRIEYDKEGLAPMLQTKKGQVYANGNPAHMAALADFHTRHTMWSNQDRTGNIRNVSVKDITVTTQDGRMPSVHLYTDAKNTKVSHIRFENIVINGTPVTDLKQLGFVYKDGVSDVCLQK